jgi:ribosome-associated protein
MIAAIAESDKAMADDLVITSRVTLPAAELEYTASRASGPGGQHVNTADTRIQLRWNLEASTALSDVQKDRVRRALASRLTADGDLVLASDSHRSQRRNRDEVTQRLASLLREALRPPKPRKKTKPTRASRERRLQDKKRRAQIKKDRRGDY